MGHAWFAENGLRLAFAKTPSHEICDSFIQKKNEEEKSVKSSNMSKPTEQLCVYF